MAGVGRIGRASRAFIAKRTDLDPMQSITAEIAVAMSDVADRAKRDGKPREFLAAVKALGETLDALREPSGASGEPGAGAGGASAGGSAGGPADELESLLGAGPALGN